MSQPRELCINSNVRHTSRAATWLSCPQYNRKHHNTNSSQIKKHTLTTTYTKTSYVSPSSPSSGSTTWIVSLKTAFWNMLPCWKQKQSIVNSNNKKEEIHFQLQMNVNWRNKGRWLWVAVNFCCCWLRECTRIKPCIQTTTAAGMCMVLKQNVTNLTSAICDWPFRLREVYSAQRRNYTPTITKLLWDSDSLKVVWCSVSGV